MSTIKTFGTVDERSLDQLKRCMEAGDAEFGILDPLRDTRTTRAIRSGDRASGTIVYNQASCTKVERAAA